MKKNVFMKRILKVNLFLLIVFLISFFAFIIFINPNNYKDKIEDAVSHNYGLNLTINGDISWTFMPILALKASSITLVDSNHNDMASIGNVKVNISLMKLIFQKIYIKNLFIKKADVNIYINKENKINWDAINNKNNYTSSTKQKNSTKRMFFIDEVEIENSSVHYKNENSNDNINIKNINFFMKNISFDGESTVNLKAVFSNNKKEFNLKINSDVDKNIDDNKFLFKNLKVTVLPLLNIKKENNFFLKGDIFFINKNIDFNLHVNSLDHFLKKEENVKKTHQKANNMPKIIGDIKKISSDLKINGVFSLENFNYSSFSMSDIKTNLNFEKNVISIKNFSSKAYDGNINLNTDINLSQEIPDFSVNAKINDINITKLGEELNYLENFKGVVNLDARLLTKGMTKKEVIDNLDGLIQISIDEGRISNLNINYLVCKVISKIKQKEIPEKKWEVETIFSKLKSEWKIEKGIACNNDLNIKSDKISVTGDGWINLMNKTMDYRFGVVIGSQDNQDNKLCYLGDKYSDISWPFICKGDLRRRDICGIDYNRLSKITKIILQRESEYQIKKYFQDKVGGKLKKFFQIMDN